MGLKRIVRVALGLVLVGCHDGPTEVSRVASVVVVVTQPTIVVGASTNVTATLLDAAGEVVSDVTPVWSSLAPAVLSVSQSGEVTGLQSGAGLIRASSGRASAVVTVTVKNPVAAAIRLARDSASLVLPGGTVQAIAAVTDSAGQPLVRPAIVWTSTVSQVATVDVAGLIRAVASGTTTVAATVDGLSATMVVTVRPVVGPTTPAILAVSPSPVRPGVLTTVTGNNFAPALADNQVTLEGVGVTVVSASATQLTIIVPSFGFPCNPTRDAFLQVTSSGMIGGGVISLQVANVRPLAVGQSIVVTNPAEVRCNELEPADGRWVVSVYNASRAPVTPIATANAPFAIRGIIGAPVPATARVDAGGGGAWSAVAPERRTAEQGMAPGMSPRISPRMSPAGRTLAADDRRAQVHADILARNVAAAPIQVAAARTAAPPGRAAMGFSSVGEITQIRIPNLDAADFCVTNIPIGFRTAYVGPHVAVVEDTTRTLNGQPTQAGQADDLLQRLGNEFEAVMWPLATTYVGNPLAMDAMLGGPGRVVVAISPRVNAMRGGAVAAFVATCDDYTPAQRPSSNSGAFVYAAAPTSAATGYASAGTRDQWLRNMRGTLVHELRHVTSFAERIARTLPLEDPAWEEGGARVLEELYARTFYGTVQRGNTGFNASLGCDLQYASGAPPCADRPLLMLRHFGALYNYMSGPELNSPLGRPVDGDVEFYAGAWSVLRWAADHFGADEAAFFRDMVTSPLTGVANLEARTGRTWQEMLGDWSLASYLDDASGFMASDPLLTMPSWNYPDIWLGMCRTLGPCTDPSNPAQLYLWNTPFAPVTRAFGNFLISRASVVGGGFTLLDLSGPAALSQVIEVKALTGEGNAPPNIRVGIVRIR